MAAVPSVSILAVEDNQIHSYALARVLQARGFAVTQAYSGQQALSCARQHPDIILLDVHLPDCTGYDVLEKLRQDPTTTNIPVILFSAVEPMSFGHEAASRLGASGFLTYPIESQDLEIVITGTLARQRGLRVPGPGASGGLN